MPERVVDLAEAVEVEEDEPGRRAAAPRPSASGEPPVEAGPVREAGERVVEGEVLEVGEVPRVRDGERDRAGDAVERLDLQRADLAALGEDEVHGAERACPRG